LPWKNIYPYGHLEKGQGEGLFLIKKIDFLYKALGTIAKGEKLSFMSKNNKGAHIYITGFINFFCSWMKMHCSFVITDLQCLNRQDLSYLL